MPFEFSQQQLDGFNDTQRLIYNLLLQAGNTPNIEACCPATNEKLDTIIIDLETLVTNVPPRGINVLHVTDNPAYIAPNKEAPTQATFNNIWGEILQVNPDAFLVSADITDTQYEVSRENEPPIIMSGRTWKIIYNIPSDVTAPRMKA